MLVEMCHMTPMGVRCRKVDLCMGPWKWFVVCVGVKVISNLCFFLMVEPRSFRYVLKIGWYQLEFVSNSAELCALGVELV